MWLCEAKPQESIVKIGQTLKRRLGIDDKVVLVSWWTGVISNVVFASRFCLALSAITTPSIRPAQQPRADTPSNITSGKMAEKARNWLKKIYPLTPVFGWNWSTNAWKWSSSVEIIRQHHLLINLFRKKKTFSFLFTAWTAELRFVQASFVQAWCFPH